MDDAAIQALAGSGPLGVLVLGVGWALRSVISGQIAPLAASLATMQGDLRSWVDRYQAQQLDAAKFTSSIGGRVDAHSEALAECKASIATLKADVERRFDSHHDGAQKLTAELLRISELLRVRRIGD